MGSQAGLSAHDGITQTQPKVELSGGISESPSSWHIGLTPKYLRHLEVDRGGAAHICYIPTSNMHFEAVTEQDMAYAEMLPGQNCIVSIAAPRLR